MNPYINLNRIEFVVTDSCTGRCRHCSIGDSLNVKKEAIDRGKAVETIKKLAGIYKIESVMTFGGEPLLYSDTVYAMHKTAAGCGIPKRQIITNGFFTKDEDKINDTAKKLKESGVNSLLLSADTFHMEHIPIKTVYLFAEALHKRNIEGFKLHPAWVVNREHKNPHNIETENCLAYFAKLQIPVSKGNNIFPAGSAVKYLSGYYEKKPVDLNVKCGEMPYTERLDDIKCLSIKPDGDVAVCGFSIGNIYQNDIIDIIKDYDPRKNRYTAALLDGGVRALTETAEKNGIAFDISKHYSACGACREIMAAVS
ncbi:MAG: radical SAM protein [Oscillospiraceae bacterium]|nr:radical SAM protein [Oscillospiraceae bacterium]